jgi:hypothetical protein
MSELLEFDEESWNNLIEMIKSPDEPTRRLVFGMLQSIDYNNTNQITSFEEFMHITMGLSISTSEKGEIIQNYFNCLEKSNGHI